MSETVGSGFRVDPDKLTSLIELYRRAAEDVADIVVDLRRRGRLAEPWMQDPISIAMAAHYNEVVMDSPYSTYAALRAYERQLREAVTTLEQMLADYRRTEAAVAAAFPRQ